MRRVLIVGGGQAGARVALGLRERGFAGEVVLLGEETHYPYERPPLSKALLLGTADGPAFVAPPEEFRRANVRVIQGLRATAVDWSRRAVVMSDGAAIRFDALVVATGARPRRLPWGDDGFVHYLRTLEDAAALRALAPGRVAIIGGGVIGLEVAGSLQARGHEIIVIDRADHILPRSLERNAAQHLADLHRVRHVNVRLGVTVEHVKHEAMTKRLLLSDGAQLVVDHVVAGIGIEPNIDWLGMAGADCNPGLRVDHRMRTAIDEVWAIGDAAVVVGHPLSDVPVRFESWAHANESAGVAAADILAQEAPALEAPWVWSDQAGVRLQIIGFPRLAEATVRVAQGGAAEGTVFAHLREGRLVGATLVDAPRAFRMLRKCVTERAELSAADMRRVRSLAAH